MSSFRFHLRGLAAFTATCAIPLSASAYTPHPPAAVIHTKPDRCAAPRLIIRESAYGQPVTAIAAQQAALTRMFNREFTAVCRAAPDSWRLLAAEQDSVQELHPHNAADANTLAIYRSPDSGFVLLEYPYQRRNGDLTLPTSEEIRTAIICASDSAQAFDLDPSDCLTD